MHGKIARPVEHVHPAKYVPLNKAGPAMVGPPILAQGQAPVRRPKKQEGLSGRSCGARVQKKDMGRLERSSWWLRVRVKQARFP